MLKILPLATICLATGLTGLVAGSSSALELTINGDFEAGDLSGFTFEPAPPQTIELVTDPAEVAGGSFAAVLDNSITGAGLLFAQNNIGVGIVVPNETVEISFDARGEVGVAAVLFAEFFSELGGGGVSSTEILSNAPIALSDAFQTFTFTTTTGFDVDGGVTLQFNAATGAVTGSALRVYLDNVSVSVVRDAVPEPASLALLGAGGLALLARRRRIG